MDSSNQICISTHWIDLLGEYWKTFQEGLYFLIDSAVAGDYPNFIHSFNEHAAVVLDASLVVLSLSGILIVCKWVQEFFSWMFRPRLVRAVSKKPKPQFQRSQDYTKFKWNPPTTLRKVESFVDVTTHQKKTLGDFFRTKSLV